MNPAEIAKSIIAASNDSANVYDAHRRVTDIIRKAIADARAAGFAEAIEKAAKEAVQYADWAAHCAIKNPGDARSFDDIQGAALEIADAIRALTPATSDGK